MCVYILFRKIFKLVPTFPFKKQDLNSWVMLRFIAVLIPIVFILLKITSGKWLESSALSVAVGLMPEMLPVWVAL